MKPIRFIVWTSFKDNLRQNGRLIVCCRSAAVQKCPVHLAVATVGYELLRPGIRFTVPTTQWYRNIFPFPSQTDMNSTYFLEFFRSISKSLLSLTTDKHTDFALALHVDAIREVSKKHAYWKKKKIILSNVPANRLSP